MAPNRAMWIENLILMLSNKSKNLILVVNNILAPHTRIDINIHTNNKKESILTNLYTVSNINPYNNLHKFTISATVAQHIITKTLIQPISFITHGQTGTKDECVDYCKGVTNLVTGIRSQHLWHTLMNADSTPGKTKTTMERNDDCKWKGGPGRLRGTEEQGTTMKMYKRKKKTRRK